MNLTEIVEDTSVERLNEENENLKNQVVELQDRIKLVEENQKIALQEKFKAESALEKVRARQEETMAHLEELDKKLSENSMSSCKKCAANRRLKDAGPYFTVLVANSIALTIGQLLKCSWLKSDLAEFADFMKLLWGDVCTDLCYFFDTLFNSDMDAVSRIRTILIRGAWLVIPILLLALIVKGVKKNKAEVFDERFTEMFFLIIMTICYGGDFIRNSMDMNVVGVFIFMVFLYFVFALSICVFQNWKLKRQEV